MEIATRKIKQPVLLHNYMREENVRLQIEEDIATANEFYHDLVKLHKDYMRAGFNFNINKLKQLYKDSCNYDVLEAETIVKRHFYESLLLDLDIDTNQLNNEKYENTESEHFYNKENYGIKTETTSLQGRNEQNQGISRGTNQSRRSYSENKRDGLADIAIVSDADHHFHLWEDCVIDEPEYITTALSRDYIRCEQANKELSKQLEWLETDEEGLFTEVSFEDFEKEMQAREDIAGANCFKLDFINRIITNLNSIEKELYQEFNTNINNLSKRENQNYTVYLNENEYSECLEYEMVIGKNDDETDKKIKVTVYYSYRSDGYLSIWKENRIDNIFIENINLGKIIKVSNLEYESFYRAVYDSLSETDRKEYETKIRAFKLPF